MKGSSGVGSLLEAMRQVTPGGADWVWVLIVFVAYVVSAELGFKLAFATKQVTAVWPPTGIALAAYLLRGPRVWPAIFCGAFLVNALSHELLATAAGIAVGNTMGPLVGALLMHTVAKVETPLNRVRDVLALAIFGCALAMAITASNGVLNLAIGGIVPWAAVSQVWPVWWAGDAMGALLVAPVILTASTAADKRYSPVRQFELGVLAAVLILVTVATFSIRLPLAYPVYPLVIWIALRFGQRETSAAVLLVSAVAVWQTVHDQGPFVSGSFDTRLVLLLTFMAVLSVMGLVLGALSAERRAAEASLRRANDELEARVQARTAELERTNAVLERRTTELAGKNDEVEAANRVKSDFLANMSHELRTPLTSIIGFAGLLRAKGKLGELEARYVERINGASNTLLSLINNVLDFSKVEAGQVGLQLSTIHLETLAQSVALMLDEEASEKGLSLVVEIDPDVPRQIVTDAPRLNQVIINLISNAIKFTSAGSVRLSIGRSKPERLRFEVIDTGIGIPPDRLESIFGRFVQADNSTTRRHEGAGLGLAICKEVVQLMGGRIGVESQPERGSTFWFEVPLSVPADNRGSPVDLSSYTVD